MPNYIPGADYKEMTQVGISLFCNASQSSGAATGVLTRGQAQPGCKLSAGAEHPRVRNGRGDGCRCYWTDTRDRRQQIRDWI